MKNKIRMYLCPFNNKECIARVYGYCCAEETSRIKNDCDKKIKTSNMEKNCSTCTDEVEIVVSGVRSKCDDCNAEFNNWRPKGDTEINAIKNLIKFQESLYIKK
jgi:hypothetical protein